MEIVFEFANKVINNGSFDRFYATFRLTENVAGYLFGLKVSILYI